MINIVLVDNHQMVREGLRSLLESRSTMRVVGEAANGREALALVDQLRPGVVVMDISMPDLNGVDATRQIRRDYPNVRVIALSMHQDERFVFSMLEAGASGYLLKESATDELVRAIEAASRDESYIGSALASKVVRKAVAPTDGERKALGATMTPREREVLQLIAEGRTSGEVATALNLSTATVDTHRRNLMRKTGVHSVAELTKLALREGLTALE